VAEDLGVSRSMIYRWKREMDKGQQTYFPGNEQVNAPIIHQIRSIHAKSKQIYSSPRISQELHKKGWFVSRPRVARLMR